MAKEMREAFREAMTVNLNLPTIPETITVHLGAPDSDAPNVTVSFIDYIANVASNEVYPTWLSNSISANILAIISFTLNRVYTEFYRARGYDFDITSSTAYDQKFSADGPTFENVSLLVNDLFDSYIRRQGFVQPLFAQYCDGIELQCPGLSQWGTLELAKQGYLPFDILKYYYGDDIELVENVPIRSMEESFPKDPLRLGDTGNDVRTLQLRLNRISANYPSIPKIALANGIFLNDTEDAVLEFQRIFSLERDGIVGRATWYKVLTVYNAVKKLNELISEGLTLEDVSQQFPEVLKYGDRGLYVSIMQYYLNVIATFDTNLGDIPINGVYDDAMVQLVKDFQRTRGLLVDGIIGKQTGDEIYDQYLGIIESLPPSSFEGIAKPFPGVTLAIGARGDSVRTLQEYINVLAEVYDEVGEVAEDGIFGNNTRDNVLAIQALFNLTRDGTVDAITWAVIADAYDDIIGGQYRNEGQYPGFKIGE